MRNITPGSMHIFEQILDILLRDFNLTKFL